MMMNAANLAESINNMLASLDMHYVAAKRAITAVRPDLDEAARQAQAAHSFLSDLAVTIMRAESFLGITQPPDVVKRINSIHQDLHVIEGEITTCNRIIAGHTKRIADPKRVAN